MILNMKFQIQNDTNDLDRVLEMINAAYRGVDGARRWTTEQHLVAGARIDQDALIGFIGDSDSELIVGYDDDAIVGCIGIKKLGTTVEFGTYAVAPNLHGRGVGSRLLAYAEQRAKGYARQFQVCVVTQNRNLIQFYERRGYQCTGDLLPYPEDQNVGKPKISDISLTVLAKAV